jgi:hypothetical protein
LLRDATRQGASSVGHHQNQAKKKEIPRPVNTVRAEENRKKKKKRPERRERKGSGLRPTRATTDTEDVSYSDRPKTALALCNGRKGRKQRQQQWTMEVVQVGGHAAGVGLLGGGVACPGRSGERQAGQPLDWPWIVASFGYRVPASLWATHSETCRCFPATEPVRLPGWLPPVPSPAQLHPCFVSLR